MSDGAKSAVVHGPGEGEVHDAGTASIVIKAGSEDTAGSFFLSESTLAPQAPGPPPHRHAELHDMFYVLEGELTVLLGDRWRAIGPGTFVCVPPGVTHAFRNAGDAPVRFLNFNTPGGWERYMRDLAAAAAEGRLTSERIGEIASRYDFQAVQP